MVQWLRLCTSKAKGEALISGLGTKILKKKRDKSWDLGERIEGVFFKTWSYKYPSIGQIA